MDRLLLKVPKVKVWMLGPKVAQLLSNKVRGLLSVPLFPPLVSAPQKLIQQTISSYVFVLHPAQWGPSCLRALGVVIEIRRETEAHMNKAEWHGWSPRVSQELGPRSHDRASVMRLPLPVPSSVECPIAARLWKSDSRGNVAIKINCLCWMEAWFVPCLTCSVCLCFQSALVVPSPPSWPSQILRFLFICMHKSLWF